MISTLAGGPIGGFEVLESADLSPSRVVAYRINGGATSDYAIRVVQEMSVFPGIVLIKDLDSGHEGYTATIRLGKGGSVLVTIDSKTTEYIVRDWIYL